MIFLFLAPIDPIFINQNYGKPPGYGQNHREQTGV